MSQIVGGVTPESSFTSPKDPKSMSRAGLLNRVSGLYPGIK